MVYTNFQRQGAVINMTVGEVRAAVQHGEYRVIAVAHHKTSSSRGYAKLTIPLHIFDILKATIEDKVDCDLVFTTSTGQRMKNVSCEVDKLGEMFGKRFNVSVSLPARCFQIIS